MEYAQDLIHRVWRTTMTTQEFIEQVIGFARSLGYTVMPNRNGQMQIDFGHKKLHTGHLVKLFPCLLMVDADISRLIESVAPGRPCAHRPMKEIIQKIREREAFDS